MAVAILLGFANYGKSDSSVLISLSFVVGALASGLAGFIGMRVATKANNRTTQAARTSLTQGLEVAFVGGSVMGMSVVGLGVLGLGSLFLFYQSHFDNNIVTVLNVLSGFSLGASSIALFARVSGGIYTKAADVGADLVGKVEAGIPEDHPLNPATIADNVGDNVGDVAGMGADLFESYVGSIIGSMILGASILVTGTFDIKFCFITAIFSRCRSASFNNWYIYGYCKRRWKSTKRIKSWTFWFSSDNGSSNVFYNQCCFAEQFCSKWCWLYKLGCVFCNISWLSSGYRNWICN